MDVAVSELRAQLKDWLARVRRGEEIVVTDRGVPVARVVPIGASTVLERLSAEGRIGRPVEPRRPVATGRARPRSRRPLADVVSEDRR